MKTPAYVRHFERAHRAVRLAITLTPSQRARKFARLYAAQARNHFKAGAVDAGLLSLRMARVHQCEAAWFDLKAREDLERAREEYRAATGEIYTGTNPIVARFFARGASSRGDACGS